MLEAVKEAENFIFLEYFIFEDGIMLRVIVSCLRRKSKTGCRSPYDLTMMWDVSANFRQAIIRKWKRVGSNVPHSIRSADHVNYHE